MPKTSSGRGGASAELWLWGWLVCSELRLLGAAELLIGLCRAAELGLWCTTTKGGLGVGGSRLCRTATAEKIGHVLLVGTGGLLRGELRVAELLRLLLPAELLRLTELLGGCTAHRRLLACGRLLVHRLLAHRRLLLTHRLLAHRRLLLTHRLLAHRRLLAHIGVHYGRSRLWGPRLRIRSRGSNATERIATAEGIRHDFSKNRG